jgi:hypothetical protein
MSTEPAKPSDPDFRQGRPFDDLADGSMAVVHWDREGLRAQVEFERIMAQKGRSILQSGEPS